MAPARHPLVAGCRAPREAGVKKKQAAFSQALESKRYFLFAASAVSCAALLMTSHSNTPSLTPGSGSPDATPATTAKKRRWPPSPCGLSPEQEKAIAFDEVVQSITGEARAAKALDLLARLEIRSLAELIQQIHSPAWETRSERLPHKLAVCLSRFVHELDQKAAPLVDDPPIEQPAHEEMSEAVPLPEHRGPMPCT